MAGPEPAASQDFQARAVETAVRLAFVFLLVALCLQILIPFAAPVAWGIIISVALFPLHGRLVALAGGRNKVAAGLLTLALLVLLILPAIAFAGSILDSARELTSHLASSDFALPPPPDGVRQWPVVGERLYGLWSDAASNLGETLSRFSSEITAAGRWLLATGAGGGIAFVQFLISIVIAGVLLASAEAAGRAAQAIAVRIAGENGPGYVAMASSTVRSVCVGILGVAVIQSALISVGFVAAGVPHAGIWTALCLFLAVLQLPPLLVVVPIIAWVFSTESTAVAVAFTIWELLAAASDNVLKPILLARGVEVPMLVIFLGSIGGFISFGFIGLFLGAVVLSLGYELFMAWLGQGRAEAPAPD